MNVLFTYLCRAIDWTIFLHNRGITKYPALNNSPADAIQPETSQTFQKVPNAFHLLFGSESDLSYVYIGGNYHRLNKEAPTKQVGYMSPR